MEDVDPELLGRDMLPRVREAIEVVNNRTVNWTVAPWGVVWMTVPTSPPLATTGIPTMTPLSRPLEMSTVAAKFVGESAVTAGSVVTSR